jgi:hypothetical protein
LHRHDRNEFLNRSVYTQKPKRPLARTRGQTKRVLACITLIVKERELPVRQEEQQTIANSTPRSGNVKQRRKEKFDDKSREARGSNFTHELRLESMRGREGGVPGRKNRTATEAASLHQKAAFSATNWPVFVILAAVLVD